MNQFHQRQRTLLLCLLSLSVVAPVIFVSHRLQLVTRDGRREFPDDLSSVKYRTDPVKLNAIEQVDTEELEEPKQVVYKENDFGSKNSDDSEKNNDSEDLEELEEPKQVVNKENDFGSKNSDDSEKNNDSEDLEELEEPKQVVYKENDFGSKNSDDSEKNNDAEDLEELEEPKQVVYKENDFGSKNSDDSEKNNDSEDLEELEEAKPVVYKENDFSSKNSDDSEKNNDSEDLEELEEAKQVVYKENDFGSKNSDDTEKNIDSEDLEELEEPKQVVYKENDFGSKNSDDTEKNIDSEDLEELEEPKQVVYKENDFGSKNSDDSKKNNDSEDSEELEEAKQVVYQENDFASKNSDDAERNDDSVDPRIEGSKNNYLEKKEFDYDDETQDQEAQQKGLSSRDGDQEDSEELEEAKQVGYKGNDFGSTVRDPSEKNIDPLESRIEGSRNNFLEKKEFDHDETEDQEAQRKGLSSTGGDQKKFNTTIMNNQNMQTPFQRKKVENIIKVIEKQSGLTVSQHRHISHHRSRKVTNQTILEIKDQIIRARAYLGLSPPSSTSHLVKELRMRIREMGRAVGEATKDSDLSKRVLQKMRHMEGSLSKANLAFPDCSAMAAKLRAMNDNAEEQVRSQQHEVTHLVHLAARTTPKGLHCLSMQLTADYFSRRPEDRKLPNENKIHDPELYHYAVFSDNVLACGVVVNSTVSNSKEPEKIVLHIVTNSLNFPSISMWFLLNPPGKATIHIQNIDSFEWFSKYNTFKKQNSSDPRYTSELNYLRFYLPDIFPTLNKILLFDHDVVVQRDLSTLWNIDMKEKVIAGVGTCQEGETSFRRMDMFINFSNPYIAKRFDVNACTWAFGMNLFNLQQWRRHNLTGVYHKYLQKGSNMPLFSTGSLPLGWLTFYNKTMVLDRRWHIVGLGYDSNIDTNRIEQAAVIHFDGIRKPWMDIGLARYKSYWLKFIKFDLPLLQRCNIQA